MAKPVRTAFVLAGGGSFGAIEVGMLDALLAEGIAPDLVVGASVGAINGVYLACDPTVNGIRRLADIERLSHRTDIVVVPPLCPLAFSSYDFRHGAELIARATASTQAWLMTGGLARRGEIPGTLLPHGHSSPDGDRPAISLNGVSHAEPGRG